LTKVQDDAEKEMVLSDNRMANNCTDFPVEKSQKKRWGKKFSKAEKQI